MRLFYISLAICLFINCNNKKESDTQINISPQKDTTATTASIDTLTETETDDYVRPDKSEISVYDLYLFESHVLISLSGDYKLSNRKDSIAIPDPKIFGRENAEYLSLDSKYKKLMMSKMNIAETDSIFIYDYSTNMLNTLAVKDLNAAAYMNVFGGNWPYKSSDYMIGFEAETKSLKIPTSNYETTLVCIGQKNPFAMKKLHAIKWKQIPFANVPASPLSPEHLKLMQRSIKKNAYTYIAGDFQYFLQDYDSEEEVIGRRLIVENKTTHDLIFDHFYYNDEYGFVIPLNFTESSYGKIYQWTGKLFKNKPDVMFGFHHINFGCSTIPFISKTEPAIFRECNNSD